MPRNLMDFGVWRTVEETMAGGGGSLETTPLTRKEVVKEE